MYDLESVRLASHPHNLVLRDVSLLFPYYLQFVFSVSLCFNSVPPKLIMHSFPLLVHPYTIDHNSVLQGGREVTVHPDNTHLRLNLSLHSTAQHSTQYNVKW